MTKIFLVRHGEAEGNYYRRAQGQTDGRLTPRGQKQIECLKKRFSDLEIAAAYSSDLQRAYHTAQKAVEGKGIPVVPVQELREMGIGEWENRPWGNISAEQQDLLRHFVFDPAEWTVPGAETYRQVQDRMESALRRIAEQHPGQAVLVASHGTAIRALLARFMGIPSNEIRSLPHSDNTAVTLLHYDNGAFKIQYTNDSSHLPVNLASPLGSDWWKATAGSRNLRFVPFDFQRNMDVYLACYRDAWTIAHGNLCGFDETACAAAAMSRSADSPNACSAAYTGDEFAGILVLDELRGRKNGIGWIGFLYVLPEFRSQRFGVQLIGAAAARYRELGRRSLRLTVASGNPAVFFYEHLEFQKVGTTPGATEELWVMEKTL